MIQFHHLFSETVFCLPYIITTAPAVPEFPQERKKTVLIIYSHDGETALVYICSSWNEFSNTEDVSGYKPGTVTGAPIVSQIEFSLWGGGVHEVILQAR